ncbi:MAG: hypothetical protein J6A78_05200 [Clostridia bacterium]|nr:hypothetical protein [Oscillospiraceae bacterium]MBO5358697.1 hypothetical protein [Clostridia bacterium]
MFKADSKLRIILILLCFFGGLSLVFFGWTLTGKISGLLIMFAGVILLLLALLFYNYPYKN